MNGGKQLHFRRLKRDGRKSFLDNGGMMRRYERMTGKPAAQNPTTSDKAFNNTSKIMTR